jgi:K+ transporter
LPAAVVILIALFAIQPLGTTRIGRAFGPIMAFWFAVIAMLGLWGIIQHPTVLFAINPRYGLAYLLAGGQTAFLVLGGVFLYVTGAEALYADMGHFGAGPDAALGQWRQHAHKESARNTGSPEAWSAMTNRTPARDGPGAPGWRRGS